MAWVIAIIKAIGEALGLYKSVQTQNKETAHDNLVRNDQSSRDALQGESDAVQQVDKVGAALDTGGVPIADDPNNDNR